MSLPFTFCLIYLDCKHIRDTLITLYLAQWSFMVLPSGQQSANINNEKAIPSMDQQGPNLGLLDLEV